MNTTSRTLTRRSLMLGSLAAGASALTACAGDRAPSRRTTADAPTKETVTYTSTDARPSAGGKEPRVLPVFFSRAGENYRCGGRTDLEVGNTKVLARLIGDRIDCDLYEIEAADPYSDDYDATVRRNVEGTPEHLNT